jgi:hypothetical protein
MIKMKKALVFLTLICLIGLAFADDTNSSQLASDKLSDKLEAGANDIGGLGTIFLEILGKGTTLLKEMVDIAISNPIVFVGLLLEILFFTFLIDFFAAGWAVKNWIPIIGAIVGIVSYPHFLKLVVIPLMRLAGL